MQVVVSLSSMDEIIAEIKKAGFKGKITKSLQTRDDYSHDASMFEILPDLVVFPEDSEDVGVLVGIVNKNQKQHRNLSLTARSAGTDMTGGAIGESIVWISPNISIKYLK